MRPRLSVSCSCSLDGYLAAADGSVDWLEAAGDPAEDHGDDAMLHSLDAVAMGRATYDALAHLRTLPFGDRPVYVFTHRRPPRRPGVVFWSLTPDQAVAHWTQCGLRRVRIGGGHVVSAFLAEDLVDDLRVVVAPVLLGAGRPLFHPGRPGARLDLTTVRSFPSGMVSLQYRRAR